MDKLEIKKLYSNEFRKKSAIYFGKQPTFDEIIQRIHTHIDILATPSLPITNFSREIKELINDMQDTMKESKR